jgi:hypothetical protein
LNNVAAEVLKAEVDLDEAIRQLVFARGRVRKLKRIERAQLSRAGGKKCEKCDGTGFMNNGVASKPCRYCGKTGRIA